MAAKRRKERHKLVLSATMQELEGEVRRKRRRNERYRAVLTSTTPPRPMHISCPISWTLTLCFPAKTRSALLTHSQSLRRTKMLVET